MLGKLLKHDLKYMTKPLLPLHLVFLLFSLLSRFGFKSMIDTPTEPSLVLVCTWIVAYALLLTAVSYTTMGVIIVRFYRNLFSDVGYLSFTLPVTPGQHLLSKTLAGGIWGLIDAVVLLGSMVIIFYVPELYQNPMIAAELSSELGMSFTHLTWLIIIITIIGGATNCITYYAFIAFGQLFSKHRILIPIVTYFVFTSLLSLLSMFAMFLNEFTMIEAGNYNPANVGPFYNTFMIWATILQVVFSIACYFFTYYVMNKKLNMQ